jgi:hypothetical protein
MWEVPLSVRSKKPYSDVRVCTLEKYATFAKAAVVIFVGCKISERRLHEVCFPVYCDNE